MKRIERAHPRAKRKNQSPRGGRKAARIEGRPKTTVRSRTAVQIENTRSARTRSENILGGVYQPSPRLHAELR
jgi:hypothetical protein